MVHYDHGQAGASHVLIELIIRAFCLVDDIDTMDEHSPLRRRSPPPTLADSEVLTIEIVGALLGIGHDTERYRRFRRHLGWHVTLALYTLWSWATQDKRPLLAVDDSHWHPSLDMHPHPVRWAHRVSHTLRRRVSSPPRSSAPMAQCIGGLYGGPHRLHRPEHFRGGELEFSY